MKSTGSNYSTWPFPLPNPSGRPDSRLSPDGEPLHPDPPHHRRRAPGLSAGMAFEREREGLGGLIGPYLIGLDPTDIDLVRRRLREISYLGWRNYWIEAACWDIRGKAEGKTVRALLGGTDDRPVPVYASTARSIPRHSGPRRCSASGRWGSGR